MRPRREAMAAVYLEATCAPEAVRLRRAAKAWRASGDHAAAGVLERDAAAVVRAAQLRLARMVRHEAD